MAARSDGGQGFDRWPEGERDVWLAARDPQKRSRRQRVPRWSAASWDLAKSGYDDWLRHQGQLGDLAPDVAPDLRVTEEAVCTYVDAMIERGLSDHTIALNVEQLGNAMRVLAPDYDWRWLSRAAQSLRNGAVPAKDLRQRMRDPRETVQLAEEIIELARTQRFPLKAALLFRDGLLLALLSICALRRKNISELWLGRNLVRQGTSYKVHFAAEEMKGRRRFEFVVPERLVAPLEEYLNTHRPVLAQRYKGGEPSQALFLTQFGTALSGGHVHYRATLRTRNAFGVGINPHTFRHMLATKLATTTPEAATDAMRALGHASPETTERFYNLATMETAAERFQAMLHTLSPKATKRR